MRLLLQSFGHRQLIIVSLVVSLVGCFHANVAFAQNAMVGQSTPGAGDTAEEFRESLEVVRRDFPFIDPDGIFRLYEQLGFQSIWTQGPEAESNRQIAITTLSRSNEQGLDPADYSYALNIWNAERGMSIFEREILLSDAVLRYAVHVHTGRVNPNDLSDLVELPSANFDAVNALTSAVKFGPLDEFFLELVPPHKEYSRLRSELSHYRDLAARGGWAQIPGGSEVVLDSSDLRVRLLRERLAIEYPEFDLRSNEDNFDALANAVRVYQTRNGLDVDARVGPRTLEMLNIPASRRVEQIKANMERWRWMPRDFEDQYVVVNVPDATLGLIDGNTRILTSRVIVGAPRTPTPLFRAEIVGVTANPPWNVPASIARNEILPRLKKDARYLADRNMVLVNGPAGDPQGLTVDWGGISGGNFPYQIRQLPGPGNALGKIKLELPNRFSVFLHDTSSRSLFSQTDRYLSHGCVRVQAIKELASYALSQNSGYKPVSLDEAIDSESTMLFRLERILPVYVLYWTAIANFDGSFGFRRDVYNRDDQLIQALDTPTVRHATVQEDLGCPMTG